MDIQYESILVGRSRAVSRNHAGFAVALFVGLVAALELFPDLKIAQWFTYVFYGGMLVAPLYNAYRNNGVAVSVLLVAAFPYGTLAYTALTRPIPMYALSYSARQELVVVLVVAAVTHVVGTGLRYAVARFR